MGLLMFIDLKIIFKENWLSLDCVVYPNKEIQVLFGTASSTNRQFHLVLTQKETPSQKGAQQFQVISGHAENKKLEERFLSHLGVAEFPYTQRFEAVDGKAVGVLLYTKGGLPLEELDLRDWMPKVCQACATAQRIPRKVTEQKGKNLYVDDISLYMYIFI